MVDRCSRSVGIIGLGYVGLPLAMEFCRANVHVIGVDVDEEKVARLISGNSHIADVPSGDVEQAIRAGTFCPTSDFSSLEGVESISICVPTPLGKSRDPDVSFVRAAAENISRHLQRGQLVVLESTVYPGATEEVVVPLLEASGLVAGADFLVAFSPERIDPGNKDFPVRAIPKVVGGINQQSTERAAEVYGWIFETVLKLDSAREAEMTKLLENTYRAVNIGLVNELAIVSNGMGIDIWKVIEAASSKPFGFMPFFPGPGWGGHCIPVDPFYLTWRARVEGLEVGFIDHAGRINTRMPAYVVERVSEMLNQNARALRGARVLVLGASYKRNVGDVRESPALSIMEQLVKRGVCVAFHDPYVSAIQVGREEFHSQPLTESMLQSQDCAIIVTDHGSIDYEFIARNSLLVFDTRNVTAAIRGQHSNIAVL